MRRESLIVLVLAGLAACAACAARAPETKPPAAAPSIPQDGRYEGRGVVTKLDRERGSVELEHEEIKDLMPAMRMEFFVSDKALLKDLAAGDRVSFVVEYKHPAETVVAIQKIR